MATPTVSGGPAGGREDGWSGGVGYFSHNMKHMTHNNYDEKKVEILEDEKGYFFCDTNSQTTNYLVQKGAQVTLIDIITSGKRADSLVTVELVGDGASVDIYGLFFGKAQDVFTINHTIRPLAPHTTSNINVRGVLDGQSRASYSGVIEIANGMNGCSGHEEIHTLLVSENAHMEAVPNLDIGNNDVQCSHAVTIATVDELKKFYLESRGLSETEAVDAVVRGHVVGLMDGIRDEKIKNEITKKLVDFL